MYHRELEEEKGVDLGRYIDYYFLGTPVDTQHQGWRRTRNETTRRMIRDLRVEMDRLLYHQHQSLLETRRRDAIASHTSHSM